MKKIISALIAFLVLSPIWATAKTHDNKPTLERVVVIMRHGIRPPTKEVFVPQGATNRVWAKWDVPYGHLTAHGGLAINKLAEFDGGNYRGFLGSNCKSLHVVADVDQRTLKTAEIYGKTIAPKCNINVEHVALDGVDERFSPFEGKVNLDSAMLLAAAQRQLPNGGFAALHQKYAPLLAKLDKISGCCAPPICPDNKACGLNDLKTDFSIKKGGRVKIDGGLDIASTMAQVLLLQYTDGKPLSDVGFGEASADDVRAFSQFHALEFNLIARPSAIAKIGAKPLLKEIENGLFAANAPKYSVFVGHDTNIANIGGALDVHWVAGDLAPDDPSPGGALIFEKWRSKKGGEYVVVRYRSQTLDEMRNLGNLKSNASKILSQPLCDAKTACSAARFKKLLLAN